MTNVPQTLLLADDSLTIQRVIELTFAGEDIKVVAVSDGDQAIARLDTEPPDIVLADVGMPGRSGYDVAQHVKQSPNLAHIPVVLLTGAFEPVDSARAASVGCDAVLAKPFDPQLVIGRVRELLGRSMPSTSSVLSTPSTTAAPAAEAAVGGVADQGASVSASVIAAEPPPARDARVEDYFDRLDAAFANLASSPPPAPPASQETNEADWRQMYAPDEAPAVAAQPELPTEPQSFVVADALAAEPAVIPPPPPTRPLLSIADAFAVILAAEQNGAGARPEWPKAVSVAEPAPPQEPVITDDVIERIARRVVEQLSDRVVRETVANIASETAERLVREEIERIKAAIPSSEHSANS